MATGPKRYFHGFIGTTPLAIKVEGSPDPAKLNLFQDFPAEIRKHLDKHANITVIEDLGSGLTYRLPRAWTPVSEEQDAESANWVYPEYLSPAIFQIHLPRKLQSTFFSGAGEKSSVEDFLIAYDGMVFVGLCEVNGNDDTRNIAPMVRKYLRTELLKSMGSYTSLVIPPSPMHVDFLIVLESGVGVDRHPRPQITWEPPHRCLVVSYVEPGDVTGTYLLQNFYKEVRFSVHQFYDVLVEKSIAEDFRQEIVGLAGEVYNDYEKSLKIPGWRVFERWGLQNGLASKMATIQYTFCEHALAVERVHESRVNFLRELDLNPFLNKAGEYFRSMTEPELLNYELFRGTLDHIRSHVFVISQNKYLMYAALIGSVITLVGTFAGYFIHR